MKRKIAFVLLLILLFSSFSCTLAHENQKQHDDDLKTALFGNANATLSKEGKAIFQAIADAAALCIDQFSPNETLQWKKSEFESLVDRVGLTVSFEEINLNKGKSPNHSNVTANTHRMYTHMGWDYSHYPNKEFWALRKQILTYTINKKLFTPDNTLAKLPWISELIYGDGGNNEQVNAFSALVYYIHILGDHIEGNTPDKLTDLERLVSYDQYSTPGIIPEILEYLPTLFPSQKYSYTFFAFQQELESLCIKVEKECGAWQAIETPEQCAKNQEYASELLVTLAKWLPELLKNEDFFRGVFED